MKRTIGLTLAALPLLIAGCQTATSSPEHLTVPEVRTTPPGLSRCQQIEGRADNHCNPGKVANTPEVLADAPKYLNTLCQPSDGDPGTKTWVQSRRPPVSYTNKIKASQMQDYGLTGDLKSFEADHIVSISLDGDPRNPANIYPQYWDTPTGARVKDREEASLWRAVCKGTITLKAAQDTIIRDWVR